MSSGHKPNHDKYYRHNSFTNHYLSHEEEPADHLSGLTAHELHNGPFSNRYFLKRRVWRNARKLRRHPI
ncbi:MAG TPA: hypothetical protein VLG37_05480 [Candidatus Saccharimonadales bacterium]|nr:hypothetical protein [Candidatus Saccharimonadales bacterium]